MDIADLAQLLGPLLRAHGDAINYWSESNVYYAVLHPRGRAVIDIGADWGVTPLWFLLHGASTVYAYESDEERARSLRDLETRTNGLIKFMGRYDGQPLPNADILKVDCEGCEKHLVNVDLGRFREWCVEVHEWLEDTVFKALVMKIVDAEPTHVFHTGDKRGLIFCKAERIVSV